MFGFREKEEEKFSAITICQLKHNHIMHTSMNNINTCMPMSYIVHKTKILESIRWLGFTVKKSKKTEKRDYKANHSWEESSETETNPRH